MVEYGLFNTNVKLRPLEIIVTEILDIRSVSHTNTKLTYHVEDSVIVR